MAKPISTTALQGAMIGGIVALTVVVGGALTRALNPPDRSVLPGVVYDISQTAAPVRNEQYPLGDIRGLDYDCPKGYLLPPGSPARHQGWAATQTCVRGTW